MRYNAMWFNVSPPDQWGNERANTFLIDGMDAAQWIAQGKEIGEERTYKQFYDKRSETISNNIDMIFNQPVRAIPIDDILKEPLYKVIDINSQAVEQVLGATNAWKRYVDINIGGGEIYGFDIETFGDIQKASGEFGITEIGLNKRIYQGYREQVTNKGYSYAFGLSDSQQTYMNSLLKQFESQGWDSLNATEQSSLKRMSMYGWSVNWNDVFENRSIDESLGLPHKSGVYTLIKKIEEPTLDIRRMRQGIINLSNKSASGFQVDIKDFLKDFSQFVNDDDKIFYGANSNFDINGISNVMKQLGMKESLIAPVENMTNNTLDIVYMARALGTMNETSVQSYMEDTHVIRAGASVDELMKALKINGIQEHQAFSDTKNEGNVLDRLAIDTSGKLNDVLSAIIDEEEDIKDYFDAYTTIADDAGDTIDNTVFLIKNGTFNKEDANEFAYVKGQDGKANLSIANEYWKIDKEHTGYFIDKDGKQSDYILTLSNYADMSNKSVKDPTRIVFTGKNEKETLNRLFSMSNMFNDEQITPRTARAQQEAKRIDFARREFQRLFSVNEIRMDKGKQIHGFDELKQYMQLENDIEDFITHSAKDALATDPKALQAVEDFGKVFAKGTIASSNKFTTDDILMVLSHMGDKGSAYKKELLYSDYKLEAYRGMHAIFSKEKDFLNDIIARVDNAEKSLPTNMDRTMLASDLYHAGESIVDDAISKRKTNLNNLKFNISDVFGIDVMTDNGVKRINGYSPETIANDLSRIFKNVSNGTNVSAIHKILTDMEERDLFDIDTDYVNFSHILDKSDISSSGGLSKSLNSLAQDMAYSLYNKNIEHYFEPNVGIGDYFYNNIDIMNEFKKRILELDDDGKVIGINSPKNLTFTEMDAMQYMQKMNEYNKPRTKAKIITELNGVENEFANKPRSYISNTMSKDDLKDVVANIMDAMNIASNPTSSMQGTGSEKLIYEIFNGKEWAEKGKEAKYKPYALAKYADDGLQGVVVTPDGGNKKQSAFMFLTTEKDIGKLYENINKLETSSFNSYMDMANTEAAKYGAVIELPHLNKYAVELDAKGDVLKSITTIRQGAYFEKNVIPKARTYTIEEDGKTLLRTFLNAPEYEVASLYRQSAGKAIPYVLEGNYEKASKAMRRRFNDRLSELPASPSYRGKEYTVHHGPSDFIMASEVEMGEAMQELFKRAVHGFEEVNEHNLNTAQGIVYAFGKARDIEMRNNDTFNKYFDRIMNNEEFMEYFQKRLYIGKVTDDTMELSGIDMHNQLKVIANNQGISFDAYNKSIFHILKDIIDEDVKVETRVTSSESIDEIFINGKMFHGDTREFIDDERFNKFIEPVLSESAAKKGYIALGVSPASYNYGSVLNSTLRPLFIQQNNGLPFNKSDIDISEFTGAFENSISVGHNTLETAEYKAREALLIHEGIDVGERNFVMKTKETSVYDLNRKWLELGDIENTNAKSIINDLNINEDTYKKALEFMSSDISSMHEDKIFIAPILKQQKLYQDRDAIKLEINHDTLNMDITEQRLRELQDTYIDRNTIIGLTKSNEPVFYTGSKAMLAKEDVDDLLDFGKARLFTDMGDVVDDKMIFNGAEKATVHTVDMKSFTKYIGLDINDANDKQLAQELANRLFAEVSDGALAIASFGFGKHGEQPGLQSIWNLIETRYTEYAENNHDDTILKEFVQYIDDNFKGHNVSYKVHPDEYRLIANSMQATNLGHTFELLYEKLKDSVDHPDTSDTFFTKYQELNKSIIEELEDMKSKDIIMALVQRQNMNEHIGNKLFIDQRMRQSIVMRGLNYNGNMGIQEIDTQYMDMIERYSKYYDSTSTSLSENYDSLQTYINKFGKAWNKERTKYNKSQEDMQRTMHGVSEVINYFDNPMSIDDIEKKAIVQVDINEFLDNIHDFKSGVSSEDLRSTIFYVDGEPSDWLKEKIAKQGIQEEAYKHGYSIFINTGSLDVTVNKKKADGFLIPIQSVNGSVEGKKFFIESQKDTVKFINSLIGYMKQQKEYDGKPVGENVGKAISEAYSNYVATLKPQMKYLKKESDIYKSFQHFVMPTSQELMGQDETSSLLISQLQDDNIAELADKKYKLQKQLARQSDMSSEDIKTAVQELDKVSEELNKAFKTLADDIRNDEKRAADIFDNFATIHDDVLAKANTVTIDGKKYHGMGIALSEEAIERQGLNFGALAMDIIADYEDVWTGQQRYTSGLSLPEFDKFVQYRNVDIEDKISKIETELSKELNGYSDIKGKNVLERLNNWINANDMDKKGWITTRNLNNAIANSERANTIMDIFRKSGLGQDYMHEIGIFGDFQRFPSFRGQPSVKILLDPKMKGYQFRSLNPVLSMLSNLDFDGDKAFLMAMLDGMSALKQGVDDKSPYAINKEIYERFVTSGAENLLADLIEKGGAFKKEDPYATVMHQAQLLKIFDDKVYDEGLQNFLTANGYDMTLKDLKNNDSLLYAAENSTQMADRFKVRGFNAVMESGSRVAALAARIRKKNIGYVSTPNYMMRETLMQFMNDSATTQEQKNLAAQTLELLTNMFSQEGGLFDMAEQKSIDTKHAKDGLEISKVTRWAVNIKELMGKGKVNEEYARTNLINMLASMENVLGIKDNADISRYADIIMHSTIGEIENMDIEDAGIKNALKGLSGIYELVKTTNVSDIYNKFVSDNAIDSIAIEFSKMSDTDIEALKQSRKYTGLNEKVVDAIANVHSADVKPYNLYGVYYTGGKFLTYKDDLASNVNSRAYVYIGEQGFQEINMEDFSLTDNIVKHIQEPDNKSASSIIAYNELVNNPELQKQLRDEMLTSRIEKSLNSMVFDKVGKIRNEAPSAFIKMPKTKNNNNITEIYNAFDPVLHNYLSELYVNGAQTTQDISGKYHSSVYTNIKQLSDAYDTLVIRGKVAEGNPQSGAELIKQLNKAIAENPNKYIDPSGILANYDVHLRDEMIKYFGSENKLDSYIKIGKDLVNFDMKKYNQVLEHLHNNTYNIDNEKQRINKIFVGLDKDIQELRKIPDVTNADIQTLLNIANNKYTTSKSMLSVLEESNQKMIHETEKAIYDMFNDDKVAFNAVFGFDGAEGDTGMKVAFGEYIGTSFSDLTENDKQTILNSIEQIKKSSEYNNDMARYAIGITEANLKGFKTTAITSGAERPRIQASDIVSNYRDTVNNAVSDVYGNLGEKVAEDILKPQASETVNNSTTNATSTASKAQKKTLSGTFMENASSFFSKHKYTVGASVATLAALGIVNNLLHNDKAQSPLMPVRTSDNNNEPYYNNGANDTMQQRKAPASPNKRVVYHDRSSGFNFKISGSTKNAIDARNNAQLLSMSGANNPTIYSQADMSGVSDNWLANEFARLV